MRPLNFTVSRLLKNATHQAQLHDRSEPRLIGCAETIFSKAECSVTCRLSRECRRIIPLRGIKGLLDEALSGMSRDFERVYAREGRPSIPPERLVRASALQILYSIRSERLLCEQLDYNLLFRWFVGLSIDEPIWDHSSFTKNRDRLIEAKVARKLLRRMVRKAKKAQLLSNEHFSVDGTLIESWAAVKSMRRRDGRDEPPGPGRNPMVNWHGEKRTNETHVSPSDPEAKLFRKGENHGCQALLHGPRADGSPRGAGGGFRGDRGQRLCRARGGAGDAGSASLAAAAHGGGGQGLRQRRLHRRLPQARGDPACGDEHHRHARLGDRCPHDAASGYMVSQRIRKRIEECFGWGKDGRPMRKMKVVGKDKVTFLATLTLGCYTLLRLANLRVGPELAPV